MLPHDIRSHGSVKRAFEVASSHPSKALSVMLVGPLHTGKTTLRSVFPDVPSDERQPCLCGYYRSVVRSCVCSPRALARYFRRLEHALYEFDLVIETCEVPSKELLCRNPNTQLETDCMYERIECARKFGKANESLEFTDEAGHRTAEMALRRLSLSVGQWNRVLDTARAIANLDASPKLKARHIAEAVQYRADATIFRSDRLA